MWHLVEQGRAEVEGLPPATDSLRKYLGFWERNLWFYASLATPPIAVLVVYGLPSEFPVVVLRWILGGVFVLFIPGYVTVEALFPVGRDLNGFEHFALSVSLSLALVMLIGLMLNFSPWGIGLSSIVISLKVFSVELAMIGLEREFRICVRGTRRD